MTARRGLWVWATPVKHLAHRLGRADPGIDLGTRRRYRSYSRARDCRRGDGIREGLLEQRVVEWPRGGRLERIVRNESCEQCRTEAVAGADGVRDRDRDCRNARVPVGGGCDGTVRAERDRDEPRPEAEYALEDVCELELRIDPGSVVGAQLDDIDQRRESFESSAIGHLVAEDRGPQ